MLKCAVCIIQCIEDVCDYINESGMSYMAVKGENFCESALNALLLQIKHIFEFAFAQWIAQMFIWLGKVAITVGNCFSCMFIMKWMKIEVSQPLGPLILIGIISYISASVFLGLFDTAVLSMMTSMAVDMDMHDGELRFGPPTFHDDTNEKSQGAKIKKMKENAKNDNRKREEKKRAKNSI